MTNYTFKEYTLAEIDELADDWRRLERGSDMTYFQSFDWNRMLARLTPERRGSYEARLVTQIRGGQTVLIAPLWVVLKRTKLINTKGVYLMGRRGWSDYLNFVYDDALPPDAFDALLAHVAHTYRTSRLLLEQVKERTRLYGYLSSCHCRKRRDRTGVCVGLDVPATEEQYRKLLSRNAYQNMRKAANHLKTDGKTIEYRWPDHPDLTLCREMRAARVREKRRPKTVRQWVNHLKAWLLDRLLIPFPEYLPLDTDPGCAYLSSYIDGELAAWFCVGPDSAHGEVVVMAVGTNEKYARYSPGILAMRWFAGRCIDEGLFAHIDFTRGDERYKYMLGGHDHLIHHVDIWLE